MGPGGGHSGGGTTVDGESVDPMLGRDGWLGFQGWGWVIIENLYGKPVPGTALQTGSVPLEPD